VVLLQACAGLTYTFAVYSEHLKEVLNFTQEQVDGIGAAKDFGSCFGAVGGILYNLYPPFVTVSIGALLHFSGYITVSSIFFLPRFCENVIFDTQHYLQHSEHFSCNFSACFACIVIIHLVHLQLNFSQSKSENGFMCWGLPAAVDDHNKTNFATILAGKLVLLVYPKDSGRLRYNCTI
jgi:hypothetical protein